MKTREIFKYIYPSIIVILFILPLLLYSNEVLRKNTYADEDHVAECQPFSDEEASLFLETFITSRVHTNQTWALMMSCESVKLQRRLNKLKKK